MDNQIKAIILDIDGVLVGGKIGINSPNPHPDVIHALQEIVQKDIPIALCTVKPHFAIANLVKSIGCNNYHITDGGGVIINPTSKKIVKQFPINLQEALQVIDALLKADVYTEVYTLDGYYIQNSQVNKQITVGHRSILQTNPIMVENLLFQSTKLCITKIMPVALDINDSLRIQKIFEDLDSNLVLSWGMHPVISPLQFGFITAKGISKQKGAECISKSMKIPLSAFLAVGDSLSDWQFINPCGYAGVMGNGNEELKRLALQKGSDFGFVGGSVDENGVLEILRYFDLIKRISTRGLDLLNSLD